MDVTEQVIDGLDRAVKNMKKGEVALVSIHPDYAFGSSGSSHDLAVVPANSVVTYEIELLSFVKVSFTYSMVSLCYCLLKLVVFGSKIYFVDAGEGIMGYEHIRED